MAPTAQQQREEARKSALDAGRYRKTIQQQVRKNLFEDYQNQTPNEGQEEAPEESVQKSRLAALKGNAIKTANAKAGEAVGASVGGAVGSAIPILGTGVGAFLGRLIGRKAGITGIVIFAFASIMLSFLTFLLLGLIVIAVLKGACDTYVGTATDYFTLNICPSLN